MPTSLEQQTYTDLRVGDYVKHVDHPNASLGQVACFVDRVTVVVNWAIVGNVREHVADLFRAREV